MIVKIKKKSKQEESALIDAAFNMLLEKGRRLSVAESFTGGLITYSFLEMSGASAFFNEGIVAYSDTAKTTRLNVSPALIKRHTAVSSEVAYEMAVGLLRNGGDVCIATTGWAGPSAPEGKLGLCFIAVGDREKIHIFKCEFSGTRDTVVHLGLQFAVQELIRFLDKKPSVRP
jgi:PncC family amidohydrolase